MEISRETTGGWQRKKQKQIETETETRERKKDRENERARKGQGRDSVEKGRRCWSARVHARV